MEKNNPVSVAASEKKFIWPSKPPTDLILSLGTGYPSDAHGKRAKDSAVTRMLKATSTEGGLGFLGKLALMRLMVENATDCEKQWNEFRNSVGPDPEAGKKCHRLNIPLLRGRMGPIDDVTKMASMREDAVAFLTGTGSKGIAAAEVKEQVAAQVRRVARQLLASLFYFSVERLVEASETEVWCAGTIRCRLSAACAAQAAEIVNSKPAFCVQERKCGGESWTDRNLLDLRWDVGTSTVEAPVEFRVWKAPSEVRIAMSMDMMENWEDISGFPREVNVTARKESAEAGGSWRQISEDKSDESTDDEGIGYQSSHAGMKNVDGSD